MYVTEQSQDIFVIILQFFIEKVEKAYIISEVLGASSNGRTRDFGSLYHGSNPCAPTKNSTGIFAGLIFVRARIGASPQGAAPIR